MLLAGFVGACEEPVGSLELTLRSDRADYAVGDPITLTVALVNNTDSTLNVVRPFSSPYMVNFRVSDSSGTLFSSRGPWQKPKPFAADKFVMLGPGESSTQSFNLTEQLELTTAGAFEIVANYRNFDDGSSLGLMTFTTVELLSNAITVQITP